MNQDSNPPMPATDPTLQAGLPDVRVTPEVAAAWQQPLETLASQRPKAGQVWRLEFNGAATLALVLSRDETHLLVAVVGDDPGYADHATLLVHEEESPVGYAIGIWTAVTARVPDFVADRHLGAVSSELFRLATELYGWLTAGRDCDVPESRRGRPVGDSMDPVVDYRLALREDLDRVAAPAVDLAKQAEDDDPGPAPASSLRALVQAAELPPTKLSEALGWPRERARRIYRGVVFLKAPEVQILAELLGVPPGTIESSLPAIPPSLVVAIHQPDARSHVQQLADKLDVPPLDARREALEGAADLRPRSKGPRVDWTQVLDDYFRHVLEL